MYPSFLNASPSGSIGMISSIQEPRAPAQDAGGSEEPHRDHTDCRLDTSRHMTTVKDLCNTNRGLRIDDSESMTNNRTVD